MPNTQTSLIQQRINPTPVHYENEDMMQSERFEVKRKEPPEGPTELTELSEEAVKILAGQLAKLLAVGIRGIVENEVYLRGMLSSKDTGTRLAGYLASVVPMAVEPLSPLVAGEEDTTDWYSRIRFK